MKRTVSSWEYKLVKHREPEQTEEDALNIYGRAGWELIQVVSIDEKPAALFKRFRGQIEIE